MKKLKKAIAGNLLSTIVIIFMLSCITLLSSCTAVVRTPRYHRHNVVVERQVFIQDNHHDNGLHLGNGKRKHNKRD